jgi:ribosomal protein S18 acetylase RimI-like enzyme
VRNAADEPQVSAFRDTVLTTDVTAVRSIVSSSGFFRPDEIDVAVELVEEYLALGVASGYHFVFAEQDNRVIGYACYGPIACTIGSYDLYWIAVDQTLRARGLGRRLLNECEVRIRDMGGRRVYIETSGKTQYAPTRAFYERCGYRPEARLVDFYAPEDDKLIYGRTL